jgi:2-haloacid dehalogenase
MTVNIKAIIFDFGGVLLKWNPYKIFAPYFPGDTKAIDDFFKEINFVDWNARLDSGESFADAVATLSKQHPQHTDAIHAFYDRWEDSIDGQIDESIAILHVLKSRGYSMFGLSNWSAETFPIVRKRYDFFDLFDGILISGDVKLIKPDPAIFVKCLKMIGQPASECLFIDDSEANIKTAIRLGFDAIHFISPKQLKADLSFRQLL